MSGRKGERGAVLVAVLMVLALLSLLGAGSMLSASLDTQATGNQRESRLSFYAAEAALDFAVDRIVKTGRDGADPASVIPDGVYIPDGAEHPVGTIPGLAGSLSNEYDLSYIVELLPGQTESIALNWSTTENAQSVLNYARGYVVTGIATSKDDPNVKERVKETVRILRRPLTQYLAFYEGDMNWRPQVSTTVNGGRIHASGNIYLAPSNGIDFTDDTMGGQSVFAMTAGGAVRRYEELQETGSIGGAGGGGITITTSTFPTGKELTDHVYAENQATMEEAFMIPVNGRPLDSHIRVGVDAMPTMRQSALVADPNLGYYNILATGTRPPAEWTDCIFIDSAGTEPVISLTFWPPMAPTPETRDVSALVESYESSAGTRLTFNNIVTDPDSRWSLDALINADGSMLDDAAPIITNTMVYNVEAPPPLDHDSPPQGYGPGGNNPDYPTRLEVNDPREGLPVDFTVVDLQRLECWYRDFLIENGYATGGTFPQRKLLVYATRTGAGALQAIKLIGSRAGRWRRPVNGRDQNIRQQNETALVPTTFVTDLPLYIEGDFSTSNSVDYLTGAVTTSPGGKPVVVIADSVTLLSNSWGVNNHELYTDATPPINVGTWPASYSAAFFTGRHDPTTGGSGPAEGVENLLRLMENWSGLELYLNGSFNSLWYSQRAIEEFDETVFVPPAVYRIGWNNQYGDLRPEETPPYVPSVFMVERESWQEH